MMIKRRLVPGLLLWLAVGIILFSFAAPQTLAVTPTANAGPQPTPAVPTAQASATPGCQPIWTIVNTPNGNPTPLNFNAVAGLAANDVWAVGNGNAGHTSFAIIEHWDGSSWQIANYAAGANASLNGVAEVAANDVWAVGVDGLDHTLALHWDGSAWSRIPSPSPTNYDGLTRLAALSASDIWAVGYTSIVTGSLSTMQTLTEHWDGSSWQVVPSPSAGNTNNDLIDVSAISSNDIWAVGYYGYYGQPRNLAEHWDGQIWSIVDSPNPLSYGDSLFAVRAVATDNVWATGYSDNGHSGINSALHWDGSSWQAVNIPSPGVNTDGLNGLAVISANDIWAVGAYIPGLGQQTLIEHWDGSAWSVVPSPNMPGVQDNSLAYALALSSADIWAVGGLFPYTPGTLAEHYGCIAPTTTPTVSATPTLTPSPSATPSASATPTLTPPPSATDTPSASATPMLTPPPSATWTATPTSLPATATAIATPAATASPCGPSYPDVTPEYWAYGYIHYLSCHSIVSGYPDGLFHPDNPISRAEFSKMLALGYGLPLLTPAQPSFADVPASYWAYTYIESLHAEGAISGYADGLFHPNASISRAEMVKMNVLASGVAAYTGALADYPDVPASYWAYGYIKTATYKQWVGGYPDGLFQPGSRASRAELSKVLYLSLSYPRR